MPEGVRDVVGRRLGRRSAQANQVLSVAAVFGRDFDVELLAALCDGPEDNLLDALDEAVRAGLVQETGADRYRFAHVLVRTTLSEELSATRRRRLHQVLGLLDHAAALDAPERMAALCGLGEAQRDHGKPEFRTTCSAQPGWRKRPVTFPCWFGGRWPTRVDCRAWSVPSTATASPSPRPR